MSYEKMTTLLDDFGKLPVHVERPPTFMEIAGYPHYENVSSNILAFFLDPEEQHRLGPLVLDALTGVKSIATTDGGVGGNVSVEREVLTDKNNRIDILIESNTHAILIENKIFAGVGNLLDDYTAYMDQRTPNDRTKLKFLLTLFPTIEGSRCGFKNLTYADFVDRIRSRLGHYVSKADTRYLTLLLDFLNTLVNLQEGTHMNKEFLNLLSEREDDAANLLAELVRFKDELRKKVRELGSLIDVEEYQNVQQFFYRQKAGLYDVLVYHIRISDALLVSVDVIVNSKGWEIYIWPRQGDRSELADLLTDLGVPNEEGDLPIPSTQDNRFLHSDRFDYNENLDRISPVLQDLVDKLATA